MITFTVQKINTGKNNEVSNDTQKINDVGRNATLVADILIFRAILKRPRHYFLNHCFPEEKYLFLEQCRSDIILHVLSRLIVIKTVRQRSISHIKAAHQRRIARTFTINEK